MYSGTWRLRRPNSYPFADSYAFADSNADADTFADTDANTGQLYLR
jgi:hypothetical protein